MITPEQITYFLQSYELRLIVCIHANPAFWAVRFKKIDTGKYITRVLQILFVQIELQYKYPKYERMSDMQNMYKDDY